MPGTIFFFSLTELIYNLMIVERVLRNRKDVRQATQNIYAAACQQEDGLFMPDFLTRPHAQSERFPYATIKRRPAEPETNRGSIRRR